MRNSRIEKFQILSTADHQASRSELDRLKRALVRLVHQERGSLLIWISLFQPTDLGLQLLNLLLFKRQGFAGRGDTVALCLQLLYPTA